VQHSQLSLDGDMAGIIVPSKGYETVLHDPFGYEVLVNDSVYPAPNRFYVHWFMKEYFTNIPLILNHIFNPIPSVYLATAFVKTFFQLALIFLLSAFICKSIKFRTFEFILSASLITPLFQTFGYHGYLGIIDHSITYSFFYAFSSTLVLLYFLPFYLELSQQKIQKFSIVKIFLLILLSVIISFSGPLNPPFLLLLSIIFAVGYWSISYRKGAQSTFHKRLITVLKTIPTHVFVVFGFASILALYSLFIGQNNAENLWKTVSLTERFIKIPVGLYYQFTQKPGPLILLLSLVVNTLIIKRFADNHQARWILNILKGLVAFSIIYILLLPFGGYREYRPNIIRRDTIQPVLLAMFYYFGITTFYLIIHAKLKRRNLFITYIICILAIFTFADAQIIRHNACEKQALETIARSPEQTVLLSNDCTVLSWHTMTNPDESQLNCKLLQLWGIIHEDKRYYQP
jgi:hypothetical protein